MRLYRLLTALALPLGIAAAARAADPSDAAAPQASPWKSPAIAPTAYNPSRYSPPACAPPPSCLPPPGMAQPGAAPSVPPQPGQVPGQAPSPTPAPSPALSPVQTPEAAAAAPQTEAFSQAPAAGGAAAFAFVPNMIGDLGFSALAAAGTSTVTPRPPVSVPGKAGGLVGAIAATGQGAFKITENESPRPVDRVFANYNFFNRVGSGLGSDIPTFDVHRETLGFEKTFLDGDASVGMRVSATQTAGDGSFTASDFNNVNVITKYALINDRASGDVWSVGFAVSVPTGPPIDLPDGGRINPVLLQPWTGYIYNLERLYVHGFSSIIVPTDARDVLLLANDVGVGYYLFRPRYPEDYLVTYVIPTVEAHVTTPLTHRGAGDFPVGFPDLVVLTTGTHFGLGRWSNLTVGVAVPVTGPRMFDLEAFAQFNWRF